MKLQVLSDTHEQDYVITSGVDVVVHCGDFSNGGGFRAINEIKKFVNKCKEANVEYVLVLGNHDYYNSKINQVYLTLDNLGINYLKAGKEWKYKDYTFVGGTLFTNFRSNREDEFNVDESKRIAYDNIQDFHSIKDSYIVREFDFNDGDMFIEQTYITPNQYHTYCNTEYNWIEKYRHKDNVVVVTHFPYSIECISEYYKNHNNPVVQSLNKYFINDFDVKGFKTILSGHTHSSVDKVVDGCRLVVNPLGYAGEMNILRGEYNECYIVDV